MKTSNLIPIFLIIAGLVQVLAQTPNPLLPANPVLRRTPAFSSWTITFKYKDEESKRSSGSPPMRTDRIQSTTLTKTNKTYKEITTFGTGRKSEKWIFDGIQLMTAPEFDVVVVIPAPAGEEYPSPDYSDYGQGDFEGLGWISLKNFKGVKDYEGMPAFMFEEGKAGSTLTAFLSIETQLPLFFSNEEASRSYLYNPSPSLALTLPEKFFKVLQTHRKGLELLKRNPSPP